MCYHLFHTFRGGELHLRLQQNRVAPGGQSWRLRVLLPVNLTWTHTRAHKSSRQLKLKPCFYRFIEDKTVLQPHVAVLQMWTDVLVQLIV